MIYFIKHLTLFALLFLSVNLAENKEVFSKHVEFSLAKVSGSLLNSVASYVVCQDVEISSDEKFSRECSIVHGNMAEKSELATCNITFQGKFTDDYTIHALSADKMAVVWCDDDDENTEHLLRYTFVQFPDCKTDEVTVAFDDHVTLSNAVNYYGEALIINEDGTYDAFFANPKLCGEKVCRLTIDSQGKAIKGPTASYVPIDNPVALTEASPVNNSIGLAELGIDTGNTRVSLVTPDGIKVLREFPTVEWSNNDFTISLGMIRGCRNKGDQKIECETFDASGKSLSKSDIDLGQQDFEKIATLNLPNGEFVLMTISEDGYNSNITKFDADNKRLGTIQLPESTCENDIMIGIKGFYRENNQNCLSDLCYDIDHVDLSKNCYDDNEFK